VEDQISEVLSPRHYTIGLQLLRQFRSVWRPLVQVVEDCPLALCDRRTVPKSDLVEADKIHHDHLEEGYYVKYNPAHQWYWLSEQKSNEVALFVTWDSEHERLAETCE
jgi:hypothetical protein